MLAVDNRLVLDLGKCTRTVDVYPIYNVFEVTILIVIANIAKF